MKLHNNLYTIEHCKDIYKRILKEIELMEQWAWPEVSASKLEHYNKACALLELLENIMVGSVRLGYNVDSLQFNQRIKSFAWLLK